MITMENENQIDPFSIAELEEALEHAKPVKASGLDGIRGRSQLTSTKKGEGGVSQKMTKVDRGEGSGGHWKVYVNYAMNSLLSVTFQV